MSLLSDLNRELIDTYRAIKQNPSGVLECLRRIPSGEEAYYALRSDSREDASSIERAARFLYLNRNCFNGLYRTNAAGQFNVPYGPPKKPLLSFEQDVLRASHRLAKAVLKTQDFEDTLTEARSGDFVYLDPPYAVDDRRIFREYLPGSFSRQDLKRLQAALLRVDGKGAAFVLSYADSSEGRSLAAGWYSRIIVTQRHVAGFSGSRRKAREYLISNRPLTPCDL